MAQYKGAPSLFGQNTKEVSVRPEKKAAETEVKSEAEKNSTQKTEEKTSVKKAPQAEKTNTVKTETAVKQEPKAVTAKSIPVMPKPEETPSPAPTQYVSRLHLETDKSKVGRPRQEGEFKMVSVRLTLENYETAVIDGAQYGGLTGFVNYLIRTYSENNKK